MFDFKLIRRDGKLALFEVRCNNNSNYNIDNLEAFYNGTWYTPTKSGLVTLRNIADDRIRKVLITELRCLKI